MVELTPDIESYFKEASKVLLSHFGAAKTQPVTLEINMKYLMFIYLTKILSPLWRLPGLNQFSFRLNGIRDTRAQFADSLQHSGRGSNLLCKAIFIIFFTITTST